MKLIAAFVRFVFALVIVSCALIGAGEVIHSVASRVPSPGLKAFGKDARALQSMARGGR